MLKYTASESKIYRVPMLAISRFSCCFDRQLVQSCLQELLGLGATVLLVSRTAADVETTVSDLRAIYGADTVHGVCADVSQKESIQLVIHEAEKLFNGRLHMYVSVFPRCALFAVLHVWHWRVHVCILLCILTSRSI